MPVTIIGFEKTTLFQLPRFLISYFYIMPRTRGREHTSLTETATLVVRELEKIPGIKMIAPGEIRTNARGSRGKFITISHTNAGFELLVSGQGSQRVSVHTHVSQTVIDALKSSKKLGDFIFKDRERRPGV